MSGTNISGNLDSEGGQSPQFKQTRWSLVRRPTSFDSPESREALELLRRMKEFFARLLASNSIARADPQLGRFRAFLLGAPKHFLADSHRKTETWKWGGGIEAEEEYRSLFS